MSIKSLILAFFIILFAPFTALSQEDAEWPDEDSMFSEDFDAAIPLEDSVFLNPFGDEEETEEIVLDDYDSLFKEGMVEEIDKSEQNEAPQDDLLTSEMVRWGGSFTGNATTNHLWEKYHDDFDFAEPYSATITVDAKADLFFDARPLKDFRVFGKLKIGASQAAAVNVLPEDGITLRPDTDPATGDATITLPSEQESTRPGDITLTNDDLQTAGNTGFTIDVHELFSDFSYKDRLFFRFGKHTIKWGVGYFWSPADVLNITSINAEDPTADREGPVSLKVQFPFNIHNAYLYVIAPQDIIEPAQIALAPKVEFVLGKTEFGFGGYYQKDTAPRVLATIDTAVSDFKFFGEAVLGLGSDRIFVRRAADQSAADEDGEDAFDTALDTFKADRLPYFWGTAGVLYYNDKQKFSFIGQYFYNGDGYRDSSLLEPAFYLLRNPASGNPDYNAEDDPDGEYAPPALGFGDIANFGRHYLGVSVAVSEIFKSKLNASAFLLANMSDLSGIFSLDLSYKLFDFLTPSVGFRLTYGGPTDEFTNTTALALGARERYGHTMAFTIGLNVGSGSF